MSKVKKIYILLVLVLLLFTGSCDKKANVEFDNDSLDSISIIEAQGQENFNNFHMANHDDSQILRADVYTTASLAYRIEDGEPFSLYVISVTADVTDAVSQDSKNIEISINVTGENDVNGRFTSSIPVSSKNGVKTIKRVVKLDKLGQASIAVNVGTSNNKIKGKLEITCPSAILLSNDTDYLTVTNEEQNIQFIFYRKDIYETTSINNEDLECLIEKLAQLRRSIKDLVGGYEPYNGVTQYVFTENIPYTALAGDPIYINKSELENLFYNLEQANMSTAVHKKDLLRILCHELSHTFDNHLIASCVFDREFFAIMKELYAFNINGYELQDDFISRSPALSSGIYSYESFLGALLEHMNLLEDNNWSYIKETLLSLKENESGLSNAEKFQRFIGVLSDKSGVNLREKFSESEWQTLVNHFET